MLVHDRDDLDAGGVAHHGGPRPHEHRPAHTAEEVHRYIITMTPTEGGDATTTI